MSERSVTARATDEGLRIDLLPVGVIVRVASGPDRGREHVLRAGRMLVGTQAETELRLTDSTVSRAHAELALVADGVRVTDLQSKNGTFVGETRIGTALVSVGAEVRVGSTRLEILLADARPRELPSADARFGRLVGVSAAARRLFAELERAARSRESVVIFGAAGTGKSEASRALHEASRAGLGAFVVIDVSLEAMEALARAAREARGGTLVLEGLASLPHDGQRALARLVASEPDVRVVVELRRDPRELVEEGRVIRELWAALGGLRVEVPSLRDRGEDVPLLVRALVVDLGLDDVALDPLEIAALRARSFDDHVRGLRAAVGDALARAHAAASALPEGPLRPFKDAKEEVVAEFERRYVMELLDRHGGNVSRAAEEAGLDRNHVARLAKKHALR